MSESGDIDVVVTDRDGATHHLSWESDQTLMEVIRDNDLPILASCGGSCACATCHVYVAQEFVAVLDKPSSDEVEMLNEAELYRPECSRLSCQIRYSSHLAGLSVQLAPYAAD